MEKKGKPMVRAIAVLALVVCVPLAAADFNMDCLLEVQVCDAGSCVGVCALTPDMGEGYWEGDVYYWTLTQDVDIEGPLGEYLGTIEHDEANGTALEFHQDPEVHVNFAVTAGGTDTTFTLVSSHLSFPQINSPIAYAESAIGVTDRNFDGGYVTYASGKDAVSYSHVNGLYPAGSMWAELIEFAGPDYKLSVGPLGSDSIADDTGAAQPVGMPVSSISTAMTFTLSPADLASGSATFSVTPEPSAALMLLAVLGLYRRR